MRIQTPPLIFRSLDGLIVLSSSLSTQNGWVLTVITGVGLQSFGRIALAKVYVRTEAVVNAAADAVPPANADEFDSRRRHDTARGVGDSGGIRSGPRRRDSGNASGRPQDSSSLLKLNGVSSSIGKVSGTGAGTAVRKMKMAWVGSTVDNSHSSLSGVVYVRGPLEVRRRSRRGVVGDTRSLFCCRDNRISLQTAPPVVRMCFCFLPQRLE